MNSIHQSTNYSQLEMASIHSPIAIDECDRDAYSTQFGTNDSPSPTGIHILPCRSVGSLDNRDTETQEPQILRTVTAKARKFIGDFGLPLLIMFGAPLLILLAIARLESHKAITQRSSVVDNSYNRNRECSIITSHQFIDLIPLSTSALTVEAPINSNIKFFTDKYSSQHLFAGVPKNFVDSGQPLLLVEQVTHGAGLRDLWWDAGKLVTQSQVQFVRSDNSVNQSSTSTSTSDACNARRARLFLVSFNSDHINGAQFGSSDSTNFASSVLAAFDVLDLFFYQEGTSDGTNDSLPMTMPYYLILLDSFAYSKAGLGRPLDLSDAITANYGREHIYDIDIDRSSIAFSKCKSNSHVAYIESNLTYRSTSTSVSTAIVFEDGDVTAPGIISVALRRNFIVLVHEDKNDYRPRRFHPKSGFNSMSLMNESADISSPRDKHYLLRFDLKQHQNTSSEPQLTFLIDPRAPERIRNALVEGVGWWDEAFHKAGFAEGTLVAKIADPTDDPYSLESPHVHYVQWIHRNLRSYSMGSRVVDPRTGQILHGHVVIGSLRMRQDVLLAEALLAQTAWNNSDNLRLSNDVLDAIVQRHKQLGAHEVGHTLGLAHNFAASSVSSLTDGYPLSVMDYPPPMVSIFNSTYPIDPMDPRSAHLDLGISQTSYSNGIGKFDVLTIGFGYQEYPEAFDENTGLFDESLDFSAMQYRIICEEETAGYVFLTDQDSSGEKGDWRGVQWNAGSDPVAALERSLVVRGLALDRLRYQQALYCFDPQSNLQNVFPIVYLWHRYDVETVAKLLGGSTYSYALQSDYSQQQLLQENSFRKIMLPVAGDIQYKALHMLLAAANVSVLAIPADLIDKMPPNAFGYSSAVGGPSDLFASRTGSGSFDASMAFEMAAELTLASIFNRQRIERIMQQSFRNDSLPGLLDVVELISQKIILEVLQDVFLLTNASFNNQSIYLGLQLEATTVQICLANHLINLASISASSSVAVSSLMLFHVSSLKAWISEWNQAVNNFYLADNSASTVRLSIKRKRSVQFWIAHSAKLFGMLDNLQPVDGFANFGVFPMGPPL